jgi:hypothetical protein
MAKKSIAKRLQAMKKGTDLEARMFLPAHKDVLTSKEAELAEFLRQAQDRNAIAHAETAAAANRIAQLESQLSIRDQEVETLRAEYDELAYAIWSGVSRNNSQAAVLDGYVSRIASLEAALRKYGDHTVACASRRGHFKGPQYECDCGWIEQLTSGFKAETIPEQYKDISRVVAEAEEDPMRKAAIDAARKRLAANRTAKTKGEPDVHG